MKNHIMHMFAKIYPQDGHAGHIDMPGNKEQTEKKPNMEHEAVLHRITQADQSYFFLSCDRVGAHHTFFLCSVDKFKGKSKLVLAHSFIHFIQFN